MASIAQPQYSEKLVLSLVRYPAETEWLEFKQNNADPQEIGEYISALSNAAALANRQAGYLIWGVEDGTHKIVGTTVDLTKLKKGAEDAQGWLARMLTPRVGFSFSEATVEGKRVLVLRVDRASHQPVAFSNVEYIRIGSYKKPLKDYVAKERALWRTFDQTPFEMLQAASGMDSNQVLSAINYASYFELTNQDLPDSKAGAVKRMIEERLVTETEDGLAITNLGAILFAKSMTDFPSLSRKPVRVIQYAGGTRGDTAKEQVGVMGYASGFTRLIDYVTGLIPVNEIMGKALRRDVPMYPHKAVRELIANALIHQDFHVDGGGPTIEIFNDRMEITNPGRPLNDVGRLLDTPPRSRNESLAALMRRIGVCEERGSGIDNVVSETEAYQLPAPDFEIVGDNFRATLFSHRPFAKMDKADRVSACYYHASLRQVHRNYMTNSSLRERFGVSANNSAAISRVIKDAIDAGKIRPQDETAGRKFMRYVPHWA